MREKKVVKPKLSDFEVCNKIGAGTFGVIMRAIDINSKREYALKLISKGQIQSREHAEHIVREKNILMYLSDPANYNPFVVRAYSTFHTESCVYI